MQAMFAERCCMLSLHSISTRTIAAHDKSEAWWQAAGNELGHAQGFAIHTSGFNGCLEYGDLDDIKLYRINVTPHQLMSSSSLKRQAPRGHVKVILQKQGATRFEQMGRDILLESGHWTVYDMDLPYLVDVQTHTEALCLLIPRKNLSTARFEFRDLCLKVFPGDCGLGKVAYSLIFNTYQEFGKINEAMAPDLASSITQLIRIHLLQVCAEQDSQALTDVLRERMRRYIKAHLRAPDLSLDTIAQAMRCTKRYLHKAFEGEESSLSEYILHQRLDRCRESLAMRSLNNQSITDIALSWGFSNSAHFSRTFRCRFSVSPSEYRVRSQAETSQLVS
jgi:AraC-like DNA-binding protein